MEFDAGTIIAVIFAAFTTIFGGFWLKSKKKIGKVFLLIKEAYEVAQAATDALEDDKITKEEIERIKKEAADVKVAFKALFEKEVDA